MGLVQGDALKFLQTIEDCSINLILTDPPYIISKETGMNKLFNNIKNNCISKTEEEWLVYKKTLTKPESEIEACKGKGWSKANYLKYGSILGKKYSVQTDYGNWDSEFTLEYLEACIKEYYSKLVEGGTWIIWFDLWKISYLKEILEKYNFKQIRMIEWIKSNPQPLNSKVNYLSNCREIALVAVKGSRPIFNSQYDKGIYTFPIMSGVYKFHPTQKNLKLFEELILKHSKENDTVLDTFSGGGTTVLACKNTNRKFLGCELNKEYVDKVLGFLDEKQN